MLLIQALKERPSTLSMASRYTIANGVLYILSGALLLLWPGAVQTLLLDPEFAGHEAALVRLLGMTVAVIGMFYCFGGRSGGRQVVAVSILDRLILVPAVLIPLALSGVFPHTLALFAVLDPSLAIGAWFLLTREQT